MQPCGAYTRVVEAGNRRRALRGRTGRRSKPPPQFGQTLCSRDSAQSSQNVHSKVQMRASGESGGSARSQHSQDGRSSSTAAA
ncbi:MAG: hypothetical protein QOC80_791 [Frankiaceae bacterium]|nr:hypothetical protein [Frankiaceae bacterium]